MMEFLLAVGSLFGLTAALNASASTLSPDYETQLQYFQSGTPPVSPLGPLGVLN
jgi:hypothetical protein